MIRKVDNSDSSPEPSVPLINPRQMGGVGPSSAIKHPLLSGKVLLPTRPVAELYLTIKRIILLREPGCCFTAKSGIGKSCGLTMVENQITHEFPGICVFRHVTLNQQVPSIRAFFKHFLRTVQHEDRRGETIDLRERVSKRLVDKGRESGLDLVVFLIDEAQEMILQDFKFLKDVSNDLDREGVQLVVIMMGQEPEFSQVIADLRDRERLDLVGRFTMRTRTFRGLNTAIDFEQLLGKMDAAIYPAGSNCTWPQFFLPNAWEGGFRLRDQASVLLAALEDVVGPNAIKDGIPARQLFLAIRSFMLDHAAYDSNTFQATQSDWKLAIDYALIEDAVIILNAQKKRRAGSAKGVKI